MDKMLESMNNTKEIIGRLAAGTNKVPYERVLATLISTPGIYFGSGIELSKIVERLGNEIGVQVEHQPAKPYHIYL